MPGPAFDPVPMLDFSRQYTSVRAEILEAITQVCDSQSFILGSAVSNFETAAAAFCAAGYAVGCASGTDALWLAIAGAGIGTSTTASPARAAIDDAVLTTPFSFFASASAILRAGARPVFADIDPATFNLSAESAADVLRSPAGQQIRAILPVHLYGQCADVDALGRLAEDRGIILLEDAAQAFGATWSGRSAGSLGATAAFSFYPTKNLAACGDAGLVTTSEESIAARIRALRTHGMLHRYYHEEVGWNARMDAVQAAVLSIKLRHINEWNGTRKKLASRYDQLFREAGLSAETIHDGIVLPRTDPRAGHIFHQYVIRAPRRDALRQYLTDLAIGSEIYYPVPLHLQPALRDLGYRPGDFPEAERAAQEVLALPIYPELRDDEQQTVVAAIRNFYA